MVRIARPAAAPPSRLRPRAPEPLTLVFVVDERFAEPMAVTLYSALVNCSSGDPVTVFVLHDDLSLQTQRRLQDVADASGQTAVLRFIAIDADEHLGDWALRMQKEYTIASFYRLLIGQVIPPVHSRVIYLDADMVVEGDLMELWRTDMEGAVMLAAPERSVSCPKFGVARWKALGLDPDAPYFNAGLAMIHLGRWRAGAYGERVLKYLHTHGDTLNIVGNQEGLNAVLAGAWTPLDPVWNVLNWYFDRDWFRRAHHGSVPAMDDLDRLTSRPKVIHYTTTRKPWTAACQHPLRHRYVHYLRRSGWHKPVNFWVWRARLGLDRALFRVKRATRPIRHQLGLRRPVAGRHS